MERTEYALQVENLYRKQGKFKMDNISFSLEKGYIMGLVGRMGSGKSTLLRCVLNPKLAGKGEIWYERQPGFIMEDAPFLPEATLRENAELFGILYPEYDGAEFSSRLKGMELGEHKVYGLLSKGEKVRFQFAFAMAHHPGLLLLDEPTSGLDVSFRREFLHMVQEAVEKEMVSVIIATHLLEDLDRVADYMGVMEQGRMTAFKSRDEWEEKK